MVDDLVCSICNIDIFGPDRGSIEIVEWSGQQYNTLRTSLCMNPHCWVIWATREKEKINHGKT